MKMFEAYDWKTFQSCFRLFSAFVIVGQTGGFKFWFFYYRIGLGGVWLTMVGTLKVKLIQPYTKTTINSDSKLLYFTIDSKVRHLVTIMSLWWGLVWGLAWATPPLHAGRVRDRVTYSSLCNNDESYIKAMEAKKQITNPILITTSKSPTWAVSSV
jgi:hypothetical protein